MTLIKAQHWTTVVFIFLMIINTIAGLSLFNNVGVFYEYINLYGVHLAVILTFYFAQDKTTVKALNVMPFKLGLIIALILMWNGLVMGIAIYTAPDFDIFKETIEVFPEYAGFLIAGAIVWLFSGN